VFKQVDVAVLEVGLGGKYDATNVVCDISITILYSNNAHLYGSVCMT
jgi:folylpolyglutamate synthase/dihydropteroate synthase